MNLRVLVLGGYGIFGARLCHLLVAYPQLTILVGGRSLPKAQALCECLQEIGACEYIQVDRDALNVEDLHEARVDVVIDASGPFQAYGENPYGLVQACLEAGVNYLDFADGADFVDGIAAFDALARKRGLFVLSGVSSFPVLTAAVVRLLSADMANLQSIRGGIAPSPFAVVGKNVIRAISAYAGQPVQLTCGGRQAQGYALTDSCRFTIAPPGYMPLRNTRFSLVEVPDLLVLPKLWPGVCEVWMGAGPVPEILHRMLNGLAWLVRRRLLPTLKPLSLLFFYAIKLLRWGEHRGGMFVEVHGLAANGRTLHRSWHLLAEGEDGPYIPCMALEAVIQKMLEGRAPPPGARPATEDVEVADYLALFATRTIYAGVREHSSDEVPEGLFKLLLGSAFERLPAALRLAHHKGDQLFLSGRASVQRGTGFLARGICRLFGFPEVGKDLPVSVQMQRHGAAERWQRHFGNQCFSSELSAGSGKSEWLLVEKFGPLRFHIALVVTQGILHWVVRGGSLWGVKLPGFILPYGDSREYESEGRFHFNVEIRLPIVGLVVNYRGWLEPVDSQPTEL